MSTTTALNTEEVTSAERLTMEQAQALFPLIKTFRPEWADWKTVMRKLQDIALNTNLDAHEVVSLVIKAAATSPSGNFEDLQIAGSGTSAPKNA